jgi:hypothetical protein
MLSTVGAAAADDAPEASRHARDARRADGFGSREPPTTAARRPVVRDLVTR